LKSTSVTSAVGSSRKLSASIETPAALCGRQLNKVFRGKEGCRVALDGVSFSIADGQTLVLLGPSGAGKTTLLRAVAGLERLDGGTVCLHGRNLLRIPAERRRVALLFQEDALFPHLTIAANLGFAMRLRRAAPSVIASRVREAAGALHIEQALHRRPADLSGGERQRASLARAMLSEPELLLLDEPFTHLDPQLRARIRQEFVAYRAALNGPAIFVTHDHMEALSAGDRLAVMIDGRIVQCGDPQEVYEFPATVAIARFFGAPQMNLIASGEYTLGIRPEHVAIDSDAELTGRVIARESAGADVFVRVKTHRGEIVARVRAEACEAGPGTEVGVAFPERYCRRFDAATGNFLR